MKITAPPARVRVSAVVRGSCAATGPPLPRMRCHVWSTTGGRLEVGLGAAHMKAEFDEAGIAWEPFGTRANRLVETIRVLEHWLRTGDHAGLPGGRGQRARVGNRRAAAWNI